MNLVKQLNPSTESGGVMPYQQNRVYDTEGISPALLSGMSSGTHAILQKARGKNKGGEHEICPTITQNSFEHNNHVGDIRRLTEIECERLQGFPDDWTKYGIYDGTVKEIPKTQRYKMCGNAVTVNVVECIGKRLLT